MYGRARTSPVQKNNNMALFSFEVEDAVPNNDAAPTFDSDPHLNIDNLTLQQLLTLRGEVEKRLPARSLKDISLDRELVLQWMASNQLQNQVLQDENVPANQKSQVSNSTAAVLQQIARLQIEIHNSERLKRIEAILIECLQTLPTETQEAFLRAYEAELGA